MLKKSSEVKRLLIWVVLIAALLVLMLFSVVKGLMV